jgi:hypothetical protein
LRRSTSSRATVFKPFAWILATGADEREDDAGAFSSIVIAALVAAIHGSPAAARLRDNGRG